MLLRGLGIAAYVVLFIYWWTTDIPFNSWTTLAIIAAVAVIHTVVEYALQRWNRAT